MIADAFAIVFPAQPIAVDADERLSLDTTALGDPDGLFYELFRLNPPPPPSAPFRSIESTVCRVRMVDLPPDASAAFTVNLPPGHYALNVYVTLGPMQYTFQGFYLLVHDSDSGQAAPVATADPETEMPPPCDVVTRAPVYTEVSPGSRPRKGAPT